VNHAAGPHQCIAPPHVIPAKAGTRGEHMDVLGFEERGIQFKYVVRSTLNVFMSSASHSMFALGSGLRRNDELPRRIHLRGRTT
jgi:hypothetical protein